MTKPHSLLKKLILTVICLVQVTVFSQLRLPKLISNGMILQRDIPVNVWGWGEPSAQVTVSFNTETYQITVGEDGSWKLQLPAHPAGKSYTMQVVSQDITITINDILMGEVWLCSGQSNMELPMRRVRPLYEQEIATANFPEIRHFVVPQYYDFKEAQVDLPSGKWEATTPESVLQFSAVAHFFANEIYRDLNVPIGIINASLGGSPAEAWLSEKALKEFPDHYAEAVRFRSDSLISAIEKSDASRSGNWYAALNAKDAGVQQNWKQGTMDVSAWKTMEIPGFWDQTDLGDTHGAVWFTTKITLPKGSAGKPAKLEMGRIVDSDSLFVNGKYVGNTTYQYPPRWYTVPEGVLQDGENTVVIRVINEQGSGGFIKGKKYNLTLNDQVYKLTGNWSYKLGGAMPALASQTFIRWKPMGLYNAMINPLINYGIKVTLWYQGESNVSRAGEYKKLFSCIIDNWRNKWNQGDFPFLYVQLANLGKADQDPAESDWAKLREAQLQTLEVPNTAMAVTYDIGEWNDIHPLNKKEVGHRLALAAKNLAYGQNNGYSGPIYKSHRVENGKIIIDFETTSSGLKIKDSRTLLGFAVAGTDKKFHWARAEIHGDKVVVFTPEVPNPIAVRYAWADNPESANLYNNKNLPASPFRTDSW